MTKPTAMAIKQRMSRSRSSSRWAVKGSLSSSRIGAGVPSFFRFGLRLPAPGLGAFFGVFPSLRTGGRRCAVSYIFGRSRSVGVFIPGRLEVIPHIVQRFFDFIDFVLDIQ